MYKILTYAKMMSYNSVKSIIVYFQSICVRIDCKFRNWCMRNKKKMFLNGENLTFFIGGKEIGQIIIFKGFQNSKYYVGITYRF